MLQAMNTGHDGSLSTVHANSPRDAIARLETLVLMAGMDLPLRAIREQIASAVDVIVQLTRLRDGTRRVTHVTEVQGMEGETVTLQDAFLFDYSAGVDAHGQVPRQAGAHRRPAAVHRQVRRARHQALAAGLRRAPSRPSDGAGDRCRRCCSSSGVVAVAAALLRARPRRPAGRPGPGAAEPARPVRSRRRRPRWPAPAPPPVPRWRRCSARRGRRPPARPRWSGPA